MPEMAVGRAIVVWQIMVMSLASLSVTKKQLILMQLTCQRI
jgi:hypothetical protein